MLVKVLGGIDLVAAVAFLLLAFGSPPFTQLFLFSAGLLFVKGLFALTGDILSFIDLFAAVLLIISIFFTLPAILIWIPAFFLLAKGIVSFL